MRWAKKDKEETNAAYVCRYFEDTKKRSWIGYNSKGRYVRRFGKDMEFLRELAYLRDRGCVDCQQWPYPRGVLELSHDIPRSLGGSDVLDNVHMRCRNCHRKRDGHGQPMHF